MHPYRQVFARNPIRLTRQRFRIFSWVKHLQFSVGVSKSSVERKMSGNEFLPSNEAFCFVFYLCELVGVDFTGVLPVL